MPVHPKRLGILAWPPRRYLEPPFGIYHFFERRVVVHPTVEVICSIRIAASVVHGSSCKVHPLCDCRSRLLYRKRFVVRTIDPEVKFGKIDEAPGPERQSYVINETTVITDLDSKRVVERIGKAQDVADLSGPKTISYPGGDETSVDDVKLAVEMLKAKVDVVDFTPNVSQSRELHY